MEVDRQAVLTGGIGEGNRKQINDEQFIREMEEIDQVAQDLSQERSRIGHPKHDQNKPLIACLQRDSRHWSGMSASLASFFVPKSQIVGKLKN